MENKENKFNAENEIELDSNQDINTEELETQTEQVEENLTLEEQLQKDLETANSTIEDLNDKYLRLSAEFDNFRKRSIKEKAELILNGAEKTITSILPVIDDFERAIETMKTATDVDAVREGVELIYGKLISTLGQNGVKCIDTADAELNTDYHEAIAVLPMGDESKKGKIIDCVQKGYMLNDKVIRHSKVVVAD